MNKQIFLENFTGLIKNLSAIFIGGLLSPLIVTLPLSLIYGYAEEQGFTPLSATLLAMTVSLITSLIFTLSFLLVVQAKKVNYLVLAIGSGLFFWLHGWILQSTDYFGLNINGAKGWLIIFAVAILLNILLFRRDLFVQAKSEQ